MIRCWCGKYAPVRDDGVRRCDKHQEMYIGIQRVQTALYPLHPRSAFGRFTSRDKFKEQLIISEVIK